MSEHKWLCHIAVCCPKTWFELYSKYQNNFLHCELDLFSKVDANQFIPASQICDVTPVWQGWTVQLRSPGSVAHCPSQKADV